MELSTLPVNDSRPVADTQERTAHIVEVFSSIQGEGPHVGRRHIFLRFFACNIRCAYCDTPESLSGRPPARLEQTPGEGDFQQRGNPLSLDEVAAAVLRLARSPHDAVSLTGGEPLLQDGFLRLLIPRLRAAGLRIYLETNGSLPARLAQVISLVDTVAMDLKLPQTLQDGRDWSAEHRDFLRIALAREVFCKMVLPPSPDLTQVRRMAEVVASVSRDVPFIIQPVTPFGSVLEPPSAGDILGAYEAARAVLPDVRVIPQTHRMTNLR
jgi:organic radical activating enzyme